MRCITLKLIGCVEFWSIAAAHPLCIARCELYGFWRAWYWQRNGWRI